MQFANQEPRTGRSGALARMLGFGSGLALLAAFHIAASDAPWNSKPAAQWTAEDAQLVLSASPWSRQIRADVARRQTEDELREAGQMGQPRGFGYDRVDEGVKGYTPSLNIFTGKGGDDRSPRSLPRQAALPIGLRWESSLPVRLAKLKSADEQPAELDGEGYQIAVYGLPDSNAVKGDPRKMGESLRGDAALKRAGKKDVRPYRVEVFRRDGGPAIFYMFPASAEITAKDGSVVFEAHIGRVVISQGFDLSQMDYMGKLAL